MESFPRKREPTKAGTQFIEEEGSQMPAYVYILASRRNGTLYTGVTTDLISGKIYINPFDFLGSPFSGNDASQ
jgi:hypothetical protein